VWKSVEKPLGLACDHLVTAFIASRGDRRVRGVVAKIVALAALMPDYRGIGGNSGNQTSP